MSLKSFHIVFIGFATLLMFGFAAWSFQSYGNTSDSLLLMTGVLAVLVGIGLIVYGFRFLKKLKHVSFL